MRLSTEVFDALDTYNGENIILSNVIATGGRYGLVSANKPFELSVNLSNNVLEVVSLSCHGVTKSGRIIDIDFDSNYTNTFDTRVSIPSSNNEDAYFLIVRLHDNQWREVNELFSEQKYTFELIRENSPIDCDSLPIGLIVNEYGWRLDETEFVPPCMYVSAHPKYIEEVNRTKLALKTILDRCQNTRNCVARHLFGNIWQSAADNLICLDKRQEVLTPPELLATLQKVVACFVIGCSIEDCITLENAEQYMAYYQRPYDAKHLFRDIHRGVELCAEIAVKMEAVCAMSEVKAIPEPPVEKPQPQTPKPMGRNRWEGIEI